MRGLWLTSGLVSSFCKPCQVRWQGKAENALELSRWLSGSVDHGSVWGWVREAMWWGVIPLTGVVLIGIAVASWPTTAVRQVRGTEVKTVEDLRRRLHKERVVEGRRVAGVPIPAPLERSHVLVCESMGGGKSMVLRSLLRQSAARRTVKQWSNDFTSGKKTRAQHWPHKGRERGPAPTSLPMTASYEQVDNAMLNKNPGESYS